MATGLTVAHVRPGSLAAEMEIAPGDRLTSINGQAVRDLVDFQFLASDDFLEVEVIRADGEIWVLEINKEPEEDFGLEFQSVAEEGIKHCRNKCLFCFVDQMPKGLRPTLYQKDDDYRLSLTQGSFITLTNLSDEDFQRITRLHLSPLYISVHASEPEVRRQLLGNPRAGEILKQLTALAKAGITMHCQIVLVPGINDGKVLEKTIQDLSKLWPEVQSVAVVPVGLTAHRHNLASLNVFEQEQARQVIAKGVLWQQQFRRRFGASFVYFSDEFYVEAGLDFPQTEFYDDFSQLENGVGLSRLFLSEVEQALQGLPEKIQPARVNLATGISAAQIIRRLAEKICNRVQGLEVKVHVLENTFFGPTVTVAGLLTGQDLVRGLPQMQGEKLLIPRVMLKAEADTFLDDMSLDQVAARLGAELVVVDLNGQEFVNKILGLSAA